MNTEIIDARNTNNQDKEEVEWVPYWETLRDGNAVDFACADSVWSEKHQAVIVKNGEGQALMLRTQHPEAAAFKDSMPDGVRFLRAVSRSLDVAGTPVDLLNALNADGKRVLNIAMVDIEGSEYKARRFTVS